MSIKPLNSKGFGTVEVLLVVVIVAILGGTGYYVYHANKTSNDTLNSAAKDASGNPKFSSKKTTSTPTSVQYFTIKEWGVKAGYSSGPQLTYTIKASVGPNTIYVSSKDLAAADPKCAESGAGVIMRLTSTDRYSSTDAEASATSPTAEQYAATLSKNNYGHVDNYYFFYKHPQGLCGSGNPSNPSDSAQEDKLGNLMNEAVDQVTALLPKLQSD